MDPSTFKPLRLLAKDLEDLQILVAHLQDALMPLTTMVYDRSSKTFTLLANRHCWEHPPQVHEGQDLHHRVHSGVCFREVQGVHHKGFHHHGPVRQLNFLTALHKAQENYLHLVFSAGHEIRLAIDKIHCHLGDIDYPWPTRNKPMHIHEHVENYHREMGHGS
jgi:hypothetical protein